MGWCWRRRQRASQATPDIEAASRIFRPSLTGAVMGQACIIQGGNARTVRWLASEIAKRASSAEDRLLCIFDIFDEWFRHRDFEGCTFVDVLLEAEQKGSLHRAAAPHLAEVRSILSDLAVEARLAEVEAFAQTWHILMKGSIIAAGEGTRDAADYARNAGRLILAAWPREKIIKPRRRADPIGAAVRAKHSERVSHTHR
jgi:hypothetical protein